MNGAYSVLQNPPSTQKQIISFVDAIRFHAIEAQKHIQEIFLTSITFRKSSHLCSSYPTERNSAVANPDKIPVLKHELSSRKRPNFEHSQVCASGLSGKRIRIIKSQKRYRTSLTDEHS